MYANTGSQRKRAGDSERFEGVAEFDDFGRFGRNVA
jgi:hypothetical protein